MDFYWRWHLVINFIVIAIAVYAIHLDACKKKTKEETKEETKEI